jgi:predicted ribosomally synthesized peptide with SipW-like signal peptide
MTTNETPRTLRRAVLFGGGIGLASALMLAGAGVQALFTDTETAGGTVQSGTVIIGDFAAGNGAATFTTSIENIAPGDTIYRYLDLVNDGTLDLAKVETALVASGVLAAGQTPMTVAFDHCAGGWSGTMDAPTCAGTPASAMSTRPLNDASFNDPGVSLDGADLLAGDRLYLRATFVLPLEADNTYQEGTADLTYTFTATQRDATVTGG